MAALSSRPSLRSSNRNITILNEVPRTHADQKPLANSQRGKRTRDSSLSSQSNTSAKRLRLGLPDPTRSKDASKTYAPKSLPIRDKSALQDPVTHVGRSRKPDPPQRINGTTFTTQNAQSFNTNTLVLNHAKVSSQNDKRSLRSHDGCSRSKSELALYFPNYDELVSIEPKEPELITPETLIHITDDPPKNAPSTSIENGDNILDRPSDEKATTVNGFSQAFTLSEETFTTFNEATRIDLSAMDKRNLTRDPMSDALYVKAHGRAERQEKQLRNIEKEKAMHEKVQLERLLDGLKGHDWLRIMGISGITDGEKKAYEPKRDFFIREVRILLEKFREWKEEEKRRRVEKEESMLDEDEEQEEDGSDEDDESEEDQSNYTGAEAALRELHEGTALSTKAPPGKRSRRAKAPSAPPLQKPFTSFYSKPYLRDAAIGKHRRGRARFAFGQPLPEPVDQDFDLPEDILSPEAIDGVRRSRRAKRRRSDEN
ncbi:MAG: hypothetical protein ASARMPRED_003588 [Alectoria sarmentosa]|nr:MAG: hypothetical protein ASARMPRED_003588 [Alectoria sarmentosa]